MDRQMLDEDLMPSRPKGATKRHIKNAHARAAELGALTPIEPAARRADGSPRIGRDQVYVTRTGEVFHPAWCSAVADKWDAQPDGLLIVMARDVGARRECRLCENPIGN